MRSSSPCCQGSLPINRSMIQAEMRSPKTLLHCVRRGFPESCEYVNNPLDPRKLAPGQPQVLRSAGGQQLPIDVRNRIQHLENLVTTLLDRSKDDRTITAITAPNSSSAPSITTRPSPPESKSSHPESKDDGFAPSPSLSHEEEHTGPGVPGASRGKFT